MDVSNAWPSTRRLAPTIPLRARPVAAIVTLLPGTTSPVAGRTSQTAGAGRPPMTSAAAGMTGSRRAEASAATRANATRVREDVEEDMSWRLVEGGTRRVRGTIGS
jgi:hypothetical protein